jgi:hypothetical protein
MTVLPISYRPVVIIGAARSGTNLLRDTLTKVPGVGTWPCDEINYIWRHGNAAHPDDELGPEHATPAVRHYIRRRFGRLARRRSLTHVVEKTCANSLRLAFVDRVLPEALFVFLIRDGRDVVASAMRRWRAPLNLPYVLRKARFVPLSDLAYYGSRYVGNRVYRLGASRDGRLAFWGPRFAGIEVAVRSEDLSVVCARQWGQSVQLAEAAFEDIDSARVYRLRYEELVASPAGQVERLCRFLGVQACPEHLSSLVEGISASRVGFWRQDLEPSDLGKIQQEIGDLLACYGYVGD